jgi:hypothetical protein
VPVIIEELHIQILEFASCLQEGDQGRRHYRPVQGFRTIPHHLLHVCVDIVHHLRVHDGALQVWLRRPGRGVQKEGDLIQHHVWVPCGGHRVWHHKLLRCGYHQQVDEPRPQHLEYDKVGAMEPANQGSIRACLLQRDAESRILSPRHANRKNLQRRAL